MLSARQLVEEVLVVAICQREEVGDFLTEKTLLIEIIIDFLDRIADRLAVLRQTATLPKGVGWPRDRWHLRR